MKIYLIRHGKTKNNYEKRYNNGIEDEVCEQGKTEILNILESKKIPETNLIYSSPAIRCLQTQQLFYPNQKINQIIDDFVEINFGAWRGQLHEEVTNPNLEEKFFVVGENGENPQDFIKRVKKAMEDVIMHTKEDVVIFTHGMVMATIIKYFIGSDLPIGELIPNNGFGYIIDTKNIQNFKNY